MEKTVDESVKNKKPDKLILKKIVEDTEELDINIKNNTNPEIGDAYYCKSDKSIYHFDGEQWSCITSIMTPREKVINIIRLLEDLKQELL